MKRMILLLLCSCSHINGATTLTPSTTEPSKGVWVFIDSDNNSLTGVYRCTETAEGKPVCRKADW
jgi:hypothetical protein